MISNTKLHLLSLVWISLCIAGMLSACSNTSPQKGMKTPTITAQTTAMATATTLPKLIVTPDAITVKSCANIHTTFMLTNTGGTPLQWTTRLYYSDTNNYTTVPGLTVTPSSGTLDTGTGISVTMQGTPKPARSFALNFSYKTDTTHTVGITKTIECS
ncbi:MAG TPA: hypothetical protein VL461_14370 [Dictyobacter sp.]|nr:hypothetical protein [Dictyobacter sp.]